MHNAHLATKLSDALSDVMPVEDSRTSVARILANADSTTKAMVAQALSENGGPGGGIESWDRARTFPGPKSVDQILSEPEPETAWLAEGLIPAGGNLLIAGYPKSFKTFFHLELAVALATATPFLGKFATPDRRRVGVILMEGSERQQARRVERLAMARYVDRRELDHWLYLWYRPPLILSDKLACYDLAGWCEDLELDLCVVDAWSYVASGNSDRSDDVTPQLQNLTALRDRRPGISSALVHHARKSQSENKANRVTDLIRNSSAFGGWYDCGLYLHRKDEQSPTRVRGEMRDYPAPDEFAFTVQDEEPASSSNGWTAQGWIKMRVPDKSPATIEVEDAAEKVIPDVLAYLAEHGGAGGNQIRKAIPRNNLAINAALEMLVRRGMLDHHPQPGRGKAESYYLTALARGTDAEDIEMEF